MQKGILCKTPFCLILNTKTDLIVMNYTNSAQNCVSLFPAGKYSQILSGYFFTAPNHFAYSLSYSPFFFRSSRALLISLVSGLFFFSEMP